jgi:hypothetical protein
VRTLAGTPNEGLPGSRLPVIVTLAILTMTFERTVQPDVRVNRDTVSRCRSGWFRESGGSCRSRWGEGPAPPIDDTVNDIHMIDRASADGPAEGPGEPNYCTPHRRGSSRPRVEESRDARKGLARGTWLAHPSVLGLFKSPEDDNEPSSRVPAF